MVNYNNSKIYKLCCKNTNITDIYIGSTTNFTRRKYNHKTSCNNTGNEHYNYPVYKFIRENGGFENWDMVLVEMVNCNNKLELLKKERETIELLKPSLNSYNPIKSCRKEYRRQIYLENKDDEAKKQKERYKNNKDEINTKAAIKIICECGCMIRKSDISKHKKTKKHLHRLNQKH